MNSQFNATAEKEDRTRRLVLIVLDRRGVRRRPN